MAPVLSRMQPTMNHSKRGSLTRASVALRQGFVGPTSFLKGRMRRAYLRVFCHSRCSGVAKMLCPASTPSLTFMRLKLSMTTPTKRLRTKKLPTTMKATKNAAQPGLASRRGCMPKPRESTPACRTSIHPSVVAISTRVPVANQMLSKLLGTTSDQSMPSAAHTSSLVRSPLAAEKAWRASAPEVPAMAKTSFRVALLMLGHLIGWKTSDWMEGGAAS
mmetsp:Transcript_4302/g.18187  ORF Transcript_4302/g.18187 Transcript_4302/m.18187 type:complete len:218 (+) Transcript_4302:380-1033(+)